ncbi:MAG: hypothetical protein IKH33_05220, partial [Bacteroidales bacterium]|nr:hypothetical protein [Bacteroidales bacterium]
SFEASFQKGLNITRFAKSGNLREIYFSPRFLDFRRRRGDAFYSFEASSQKGLNITRFAKSGNPREI